jgi:hypothetical protein
VHGRERAGGGEHGDAEEVQHGEHPGRGRSGSGTGIGSVRTLGFGGREVEAEQVFGRRGAGQAAVASNLG